MEKNRHGSICETTASSLSFCLSSWAELTGANQCWKQAYKETFREEEEEKEEKPVPGCDKSQQLHCAVGREQELGPVQRTRFRVQHRATG
ncbi:hypothetical protein INR49_029805 [Caranx melampygus]|nr:hypothetical protein INR49_029805 [Caranx melampygus]